MARGDEATFGVSELQRALDCGELVRVYQPVVDLQTGTPRSVEALLRWNHPTDRQLAPNDFALADGDDELLVRIGWSVVIEAARRAGDWRRRFPDPEITVSVNIAPAHLAARDLSSRVEHLLRDNQVTGREGLAFELGEQVLLPEHKRDRDRIGSVRNLGIEIVVDDFGAADAASDMPADVLREALLRRLESLGRFPLDVIKLDHGLVDRLAADGGGRRAVAEVVERAHAVGLQVVATTVECADDADRARQCGFDLGQGFFFHRPGSPDAIDQLLAMTGSGATSLP
jgi:EAL domain-containing protein (putative c-di-GMP-specific phosphodiesterase class I)